MELVMNALRKSIISVLSVATEPMTLAEISAQIGEPVKTGTTNSMVKAGIINKVGEKTIVCACCGAKHKVSTYAIGQVKAE